MPIAYDSMWYFLLFSMWLNNFLPDKFTFFFRGAFFDAARANTFEVLDFLF